MRRRVHRVSGAEVNSVRSVEIRRVDQHVGVEQRHGSRVSFRSCSQDMPTGGGCRDIASRHSSRVIFGAAAGRCRRTNRYRCSSWRSMSKTSPGLAPGTTTRPFESARTVATGGSSHSGTDWSIGGAERDWVWLFFVDRFSPVHRHFRPRTVPFLFIFAGTELRTAPTCLFRAASPI